MLPCGFCFTPSLLIAGPRCHPSPSHPGGRNLAALDAAPVGGPQVFEKAQRCRTPGDGIRKEKRGSGTYYVRAHLCSSGSDRAAVRVLLHSLTSIAGPRCHPSPSHPGDRNLAALDAAPVGGPAAFEGAQGCRTPGGGVRKEKRGSGTYYVRAHLCSSGSGRAAVRVLLHSLTPDRRAAMPSFSLAPRRQKFGRTRGGDTWRGRRLSRERRGAGLLAAGSGKKNEARERIMYALTCALRGAAVLPCGFCFTPSLLIQGRDAILLPRTQAAEIWPHSRRRHGGASSHSRERRGAGLLAAGSGKKNEARERIMYALTCALRGAAVLPCGFCFTPSLLIAGPRCHPSPSHPGDRNLAALDGCSPVAARRFSRKRRGADSWRQDQERKRGSERIMYAPCSSGAAVRPCGFCSLPHF